jgi:hypothetical protein
MEFIKKTELFFIQLQYNLAIEPEPILTNEEGIYSLMLKPDIFFELINKFNIDYPFISENKIIELKNLMSEENINIKDALKIIENFKEQYWFCDTVVIFEPIKDKLNQILKKVNFNNISEEDLLHELINYQKHLQVKRENIYSNLISEIQGLTPQQTLEDTSNNLPEIELKFKTEQIRLLYDLGVIDFLQDKFKSTLRGNKSQTAKLISQILKLQYNIVQPTINSLLSNHHDNHFPNKTARTKAIIDQLNANELK